MNVYYLFSVTKEEVVTSTCLMPQYGVLVIPMCSVMNPIAAEADEPYESVLEAVVYRMRIIFGMMLEAIPDPVIYPMVDSKITVMVKEPFESIPDAEVPYYLMMVVLAEMPCEMVLED